MSEIDQIHVFDDLAFQRTILRLSAAAVAGGVAAGLLWWLGIEALNDALGLSMEPFELGSLSSLWPWVVSLVLVTLVALVAHELVHGFMFKQFAPPGARVSYGINWRRGMAYACAEGIVYPRRQYEVIILAPTVVVTLGLVALGLGLGWPLWTFAAATAHLSGCAGDWGYLLRMRKNPDIRWCEDTSWGVRFFGEAADATAADRAAGATDGAGAGRSRGRTSSSRDGSGLDTAEGPRAGHAPGPAAFDARADAGPGAETRDDFTSPAPCLGEEDAGPRGLDAAGSRAAAVSDGEAAWEPEVAFGRESLDVPPASASKGFEVPSAPDGSPGSVAGPVFVLVDGGAPPAAMALAPEDKGVAGSETDQRAGAREESERRTVRADAGDAPEPDGPAGEA